MKKVLIIEDDAEMRALEKIVLEERGYEVLEAGNAKEGLALSLESLPDVIIMDVRLPSKKRGIGAAKQLRDNDKTREIPIIFVTGYAEGKDSTEVQNITNSSYITKPFEINALVAEIKKYTE